MAIDINGETLIITLDAVVAGVLDVDVGADLYTVWKTWMKQGNMRYPPAFRTTGGDELTAIIDAGAYFFLRNDYGWRIKSYENDATYYLVGNLAVQDTSLPAFIPTIGTYTAAILGLQPVTQGVTPAMANQLEQISFADGVAVSPATGEPGTGNDVNNNPIGTRIAPSDNMADAHYILMARGLDKFYLMDSLTIGATDLSMGHAFIGDSPFIVLTIEIAADVTNCSVTNLSLTGELDGLNSITNCSLKAVTNVSGIVHNCELTDDITLSGGIHIIESYSAKSGAGYINITTGAHTIEVSDWHRSLGLKGMTAGIHTIEMYGGQLHLDATCTGGTIYVRGAYSLPPDDQSTGTVVIDQSETKAVWDEARALTVGKFIGLK